LKATPIFSTMTELHDCLAIFRICFKGSLPNRKRAFPIAAVERVRASSVAGRMERHAQRYPSQSSVQALFEEQAEATPDVTALMFGDETIHLSKAESPAPIRWRTT